MTTHVELPSDPAKKQQLQAIVKDCVMVKHQIETIKAGLDETVTETAKKFNLPKKILTKLVNTAYRCNFEQVQREHEDFEYIYESLMQGASDREAG